MKQSIHGLKARIVEIERCLVNIGVAALEDKNHEASQQLQEALRITAGILHHEPINPLNVLKNRQKKEQEILDARSKEREESEPTARAEASPPPHAVAVAVAVTNPNDLPF